jgi:hypothetical protein
MAFVSEIHYKNTVASGTGVPEYVEVTVAPGDLRRLSDFEVITYQSDGSVRSILSLANYTGVLDPSTGWTVFQLQTQVTDPDHVTGINEAEAVAFLDYAAATPLQSFVDIGGGTSGITATGGPASGATSVNIPAASGQTIQFDVFGNRIDGPMTQGSSVICLTAGTLIGTPDGPRRIEELAVGDLVTTYDNGDQPIRMIHSRRIAGRDYSGNRDIWPVRIGKAALGFGLPLRDLWVSPQHRMLYQSIRTNLMFGEEAVMVRAKSLTAGFARVHVDSALTEVTYIHLVFDRHEVIFAEGSATESFHPGAEGIAALDPDARVELYTIFPGLRLGENRAEADYITLRSWELLAAVA